MSRLQTKCVFASTTAHLLLLALLVVSSAFVKPPPKPDNVKFVRIFDASKITDDETQGGGNPNVPSDVQPAPAPPPQAAQVIPQPTAPAIQEPPTKLIEPEKKPEPPKHEPKKKKQPEPTPEPPKKEAKKPETKTEARKIERKADSKKVVPKTQLVDHPVETQKPEKPKVQVDLTVKTAKEDPEFQKRKIERERERERAAKEAREREEAARQAEIRAQMELREAVQREYRERQQALGTIVGNVDTGLARTTNVEMPGPGGEAFINYADLIWSKYYKEWQRPEDHEVRAPVRVEIVVNRDGRIVSANIVKSSGDAALDRSVRQTLERVHSLPAFPEGAKDAQRTFTINFYLKSKRSLG
jgi:colicin import membrane protein